MFKQNMKIPQDVSSDDIFTSEDDVQSDMAFPQVADNEDDTHISSDEIEDVEDIEFLSQQQ